MPQQKFAPNPDNFIGVELQTRYTMGPVNTDRTFQNAQWGSRRAFRAEIHRLSRYFTNPLVKQGTIEDQIIEEKSKRGLVVYVLISRMAIEITEESR